MFPTFLSEKSNKFIRFLIRLEKFIDFLNFFHKKSLKNPDNFIRTFIPKKYELPPFLDSYNTYINTLTPLKIYDKKNKP